MGRTLPMIHDIYTYYVYNYIYETMYITLDNSCRDNNRDYIHIYIYIMSTYIVTITLIIKGTMDT
jgi:hypothetical protein